MKRFVSYLTTLGLVFICSTAFAQVAVIDQFRPNDKTGINMFETPKTELMDFDGIRIRVGGDFAIQLQGLTQDNDAGTLVDLSNNFALPTANLNFDVQLEKGVRMHLRTYLSSKHHNEAWVKGGYIQIDNADFVSEGFLEGLFQKATLRFGMDEINYGDTHFRRSDNARAIYNPFVANYIMDSFTTEPFAEFTYQSNGLIGVLGISNGRLNQSPTPGDDGISIFGKLGYDKQANDDLRYRITASFYRSSDKSTREYLYNGDRAGSRYYQVIVDGTENRAPDFLPRFNPGFAYLTAIQVNPFVKFKGFEFFGVFEIANNGDSDVGGGYTQIGAEGLYRLGAREQFYLGGRYNSTSGEAADGAAAQDISRINLGGGWFMTDNIVAKFEYVTSTYDGAGWTGKFAGASFDGFVIEAAISF